MAPSKHLNDLLYETMKDIYFAEKQILNVLPRMAEAAQSAELKSAFETHHGQTEIHIQRLEHAFEILGLPAEQKTCKAILGIIEEGKEVWRSLKGQTPWTRVFWRVRRRLNTTRSADTAQW